MAEEPPAGISCARVPWTTGTRQSAIATTPTHTRRATARLLLRRIGPSLRSSVRRFTASGSQSGGGPTPDSAVRLADLSSRTDRNRRLRLLTCLCNALVGICVSRQILEEGRWSLAATGTPNVDLVYWPPGQCI